MTRVWDRVVTPDRNRALRQTAYVEKTPGREYYRCPEAGAAPPRKRKPAMNCLADVLASRRPSRSRRMGRLALLVWLSACHAWRPQTLGPTTDFAENSRLRVDRTDGTSTIVLGPRIVGDSVIGVWAGSSDRIAVAISDVRHAEEFRTSPKRTALAAVGVVGGVVIVVGAGLALMAVGLSSTMGGAP